MSFSLPQSILIRPRSVSGRSSPSGASPGHGCKESRKTSKPPNSSARLGSATHCERLFAERQALSLAITSTIGYPLTL